MSTPSPNGRELTFAEAIREALAEEMRRDPRVFILGEDVAEAGTPSKVLSGLVEEFGTDRVIDTPISGSLGIAVETTTNGRIRKHAALPYPTITAGKDG
jgi:pyruvate/2-oxoglutarate/acetoin dehydrogenase E1 component